MSENKAEGLELHAEIENLMTKEVQVMYDLCLQYLQIWISHCVIGGEHPDYLSTTTWWTKKTRNLTMLKYDSASDITSLPFKKLKQAKKCQAQETYYLRYWLYYLQII